jgi:hypothetical protein
VNYYLNEMRAQESISSLVSQLTESLTSDETIRMDAATVETVDRHRICYA